MSLHQGVVRRIPGMMAAIQKEHPRQMLVSTHSEDFLRDEGIAPDEVLILRPTSNGTTVETGLEIEVVKQLLEAGLTVAKRLLEYVGLPFGTAFGKRGKSDLLRRLPNYNQAARARFTPWFALSDLDNDAVCASQAIQKWPPHPSEGMRLRVAVRAIEAWMMADAEHLAAFLSVSSSRVPTNPDSETDPKQTLINVARSSSSRSIREGFVPRHGSGARVGPLYVEQLIIFAQSHWQPGEAATRSESLRRCIQALSTLKLDDLHRRDVL